MATVKHIAGPFENNMQECIMCGEIICDYTNAMFELGSPPPRGWAMGEIYISGKNPKIYSTQRPEGIVTDCTQ